MLFECVSILFYLIQFFSILFDFLKLSKNLIKNYTRTKIWTPTLSKMISDELAQSIVLVPQDTIEGVSVIQGLYRQYITSFTIYLRYNFKNHSWQKKEYEKKPYTISCKIYKTSSSVLSRVYHLNQHLIKCSMFITIAL